MAGNIIDMSKIKQLLQLKKSGLSNRQIAKDLKISRDKTNEYVRMAELDSLDIDALLRLDDPVLEKRFHPGNPAYSDSRMGTFLSKPVISSVHLHNNAHDTIGLGSSVISLIFSQAILYLPVYPLTFSHMRRYNYDRNRRSFLIFTVDVSVKSGDSLVSPI